MSVCSFLSGCSEWWQKSEFEEKIFVAVVAIPATVLVSAYVFRAFREGLARKESVSLNPPSLLSQRTSFSGRSSSVISETPLTPFTPLQSLTPLHETLPPKNGFVHVDSTRDLQSLAGRSQIPSYLDSLLDVPLTTTNFSSPVSKKL